MSLSKEEFVLLKEHQYCDNPNCINYGKVGLDNIKTHCYKRGQVYCNSCPKRQPFSVRKGTMFYDLRTPIDKIIRCLTLLSSGMGQNAVCRAEQVTGSTVRSWIILASTQVKEFTVYMQKDMTLSQVQIDEFWSFIKKKVKI